MEGAPITFHFIYWGDEKRVEDKAKGKEEFKLCSKCGRSKPRDEFHKKMLAKSWYGRICKDCERKYATINRRERESEYKYREEVKLKYNKRYRTQHKDQIAKRGKKYRETEAGRLICKICAHRRRARKVKAGGDGISAEQWKRIIKKQKHRCNMCGRRFSKTRVPTMDHIVPISKGGDHDASNIQALCRSCNSSKSNKIQIGLIQSWCLIIIIIIDSRERR